MLTRLRPCQYDPLEMTLADQPWDFWRRRVQSLPLVQRLAYIKLLQLRFGRRGPLQALREDTYCQMSLDDIPTTSHFTLSPRRSQIDPSLSLADVQIVPGNSGRRLWLEEAP